MARLALQQRLPRDCFICETERNVGITISNQFMCVACERDVVLTQTDDEQYTYYLQRLEKIKKVFMKRMDF